MQVFCIGKLAALGKLTVSVSSYQEVETGIERIRTGNKYCMLMSCWSWSEFATVCTFEQIKPPASPAGRFTQILSVGIGGSALGPQFVAEALAPDNPPLKVLITYLI